MTMAQAFDEWMRRYRANPRAFSAEFESVADHAKGKKRGAKATPYGLGCERLLRKLMRQKAPKKTKRGAK